MLVVLISLVSAQSMRMVVINPQASFDSVIGKNIEYSIGATNRNQFPIEISLGNSSSGIIQYKDEISFVLQPNESKTIDYLLTMTETGNITILVPITFSSGDQIFTLNQILFLDVKGDTKVSPSSTKSSSSIQQEEEKEPILNPLPDEINEINSEGQLINNGEGIIVTEEENNPLLIIVLSIFFLLIVFLSIRYYLIKKKREKEEIQGVENEE
jgi:hypothetical protein